MASRSYNPSCRVGNWAEDIAAREDEIKEFLRKQEAGELVTQTVGRHIGVASESVSVSQLSQDGCVHFGDCVLFQHPSSDSVISSLPSPFPTASPDIPVTASPDGAGAMRRTAFTLLPVDSAKHQEGQPICYGDRFFAYCSVPSHGNIFLLSEKLGLHNVPARFSKHQNVFARSFADGVTPGYDGAWEFVYRDPRFRFEYEGQPVAANEPVLIRHARTGICLAVMDQFVWRTEFGRQFEVAAHTYIDAHKVESKENVLQVVIGQQ
eukprot:m.146335 g.146335  ORF g.146335 m.146335 type:complete len:265 (+) comp16085_c0_seq1:938-1732(+)